MDTSAQNPVQSFPTQPQQPVAGQASVVNNQVPQTPVAQSPVEELTQPASLDEPVPPVSPVTPVSLPHREAGPGLGKMSEFVVPTEASPVLSSEVKEAGVEVAPDSEQPSIPADVAQMGVQPAKAAVPVQPLTGAKIEYLTDAPFTELEAQKIEKSKRASDSIRWLATFLLKQIKRLTFLGNNHG